MVRLPLTSVALDGGGGGALAPLEDLINFDYLVTPFGHRWMESFSLHDTENGVRSTGYSGPCITTSIGFQAANIIYVQ